MITKKILAKYISFGRGMAYYVIYESRLFIQMLCGTLELVFSFIVLISYL